MKIFYISLSLILSFSLSFSQSNPEVKSWNPIDNSFHVIEGQIQFKDQESGLHRFPPKIEELVRPSVWNLSNQSAGLSLRFRSDASNITVNYKVEGDKGFSHMPATGVSGVDLYAKNSDGKWIWVRGKYTFGENIEYNFKNLKPNDQYHKKGREYKLYLPLYNTIDSLRIGVGDKDLFKPLPIRQEKPIVVYGTSIAQGACASRPGMAWTSILERKMDRPLINLGFSGNGRLENEIIDIIKEVEAKVYILDCLPNLGANDKRSLEDVKNLILAAVKSIRKQNTSTPILLTEHAGYADSDIQLSRKKAFVDLNKIMKEAFNQLKNEGFFHIYLLNKEEINLTVDSTVDGTHPNDLGMQIMANAYEKKLREIFNEKIGDISTTQPVVQDRDAKVYNWNQRHQQILTNNKNDPPKICFIGNSIVQQWGGTPNATYLSGAKSWDKYLEEIGVQNFGFGWDRIENVLWRIYHDELDDIEPEQILVKIGTNNIHLNSDEEIIEGIQFLIKAIQERQSDAKITLIGILPRRDNETHIVKLNADIKKLSLKLDINYLEIGHVLLDKNDKIDESLFRDGLHPNAKGYKKLGPLINDHLLKN